MFAINHIAIKWLLLYRDNVFLAICSMFLENEEKSGNEITGNNIINLKSYITNIETFIVCHSCAHKKYLQIRRE